LGYFRALSRTGLDLDRAASLRLHHTLPAVEGIPTAFRFTLGPRDQTRRLPPDGAPGRPARSLLYPERQQLGRPLLSIVEAAARLEAHSFLIDGEVVIAGEDGMSDFRALRSKRRGPEALLYAFDLLQHDGADLCDLPLIERKQRLARLLGRAKRQAIQFVEHLTGDGPTVLEHVCRILDGIVSKRTDAPYRSGPSKVWLKSKSPASEAVRREREEEWR
jgi:bifunctional non-homologous end joining protein LigD